MPKSFLFVFFLLFISSLFFGIQKVQGRDELDDINKQINDLTNALSQSKAATTPLESQLSGIKSRVAFIEGDLVRKKKDIDKGYKDLEKQTDKLNLAIRNYYIKSYYNSPILVFLSATSASEITQVLAYQKAVADQDKLIIINIALSINNLEEKKASLEDEEKRLAVIKVNLDKIIGEAKTFQTSLSTKIAELSAKQQSILSQRLASLNIPRSAGASLSGCVDDRDKDPGFSGGFAFFTYGVPNRTGLNQYGANGRAKAGQNVETILSAYYQNFELKKDYSSEININVEGYGAFNIEEYVKRIYEMPESWEMEALKAQAIAARSYALSYTNNGAGSICTTQSCQVFKPDPKGGRWDQAVNETRGWVMVQNGAPVKAWYSSTHGGYVFPTSELPGWSETSWTKRAIDTTTGSASGFSELTGSAYDKDSPWFYCDWGSRPEYNKTAWLKSEEMADIANVLMLVGRDGGIKEHLYQVDKPNPAGTDTWDFGRVKQELISRGGTPFNSVSNVSVGADFGSGKTSSVNVSGDGGTQSFSGSDFKTYFNLRAPASIQIVGPLYNVERK